MTELSVTTVLDRAKELWAAWQKGNRYDPDDPPRLRWRLSGDVWRSLIDELGPYATEHLTYTDLLFGQPVTIDYVLPPNALILEDRP
jgi:hypothetical protein